MTELNDMNALHEQFEQDIILGNEELTKLYQKFLKVRLEGQIKEREMYLSELRLVAAGKKNVVGGQTQAVPKNTTNAPLSFDTTGLPF